MTLPILLICQRRIILRYNSHRRGRHRAPSRYNPLIWCALLMKPIAILINYKTAMLAKREQAAIHESNLCKALTEIIAQPGIYESMILTTCNRTELYCLADEPQRVKEAFCSYQGLVEESWSPYIETKEGEEAIAHIMSVASGLDSMVLGEPQILGQMKQAYALAHQYGAVGKYLSRLFQHVFTAAKAVRTQTAIGHQPVSLAYASIKVAKHIFAELSTKTVLMIGRSEMITLTARHLREQGVQQLIFSNRSIDKLADLVNEFEGKALPLSGIPAMLPYVDMVVSATSSELPIIGKGSIEAAIAVRKHKPMVLIDLAMPRDFEPQIKNMDSVYLYDLDDLQEVVACNQKARETAAQQAKSIIDKHVGDYTRWVDAQDTVKLVKAYREHHERLRDEALLKANRSLAQGKPMADVLTQLAHNLTNKFLHIPTLQLKDAHKQDMLTHPIFSPKRDKEHS